MARRRRSTERQQRAVALREQQLVAVTARRRACAPAFASVSKARIPELPALRLGFDLACTGSPLLPRRRGTDTPHRLWTIMVDTMVYRRIRCIITVLSMIVPFLALREYLLEYLLKSTVPQQYY